MALAVSSTVARRAHISPAWRASLLRRCSSQALCASRSIRHASISNCPGSEPFDHTTDVLVVGSGAAALTAALRTRASNLNTIIIEKADKIGGTSAYSGGGVWIPCNHLQPQHGIQDSPEDAITYLNTIVKDGPPSTARRAAFVDQGPKMAKFLEDQGFNWILELPYPDYHSLEPGACTTSRSLAADKFNLKKLDPEWRERLRTPTVWQPVMNAVEARSLFRIGASMSDFIKGMQLVVFRTLWSKLRGEKPAAMGLSLVAQLLHMNLRLGTEVWPSTGLSKLLTSSSGDVIGALVYQQGKKIRIRARRGVVLAAGGFARNLVLREQFLQKPTSSQWTLTAPEDKGDAINAAMEIGADVALMEHAWWMPCFVNEGKPVMDTYVRSFPHSITVDQSGKRFFNESECYCDAGSNMLAKHRELSVASSWTIIDSRHRNKYMLGRFLPRITPKSAVKSGFIYKDSTITGLARQISVDEQQLRKTVDRFNEFAKNGVDEDFQRGLNPYNKVFSDPSNKPNPNLGTIAKPPFYALKMVPGDIGTKGGLLTDERCRVLKKDSTPIKGLYAAGNTSASAFGTKYPGPGGTIGPAMTFAYIAAGDIVN